MKTEFLQCCILCQMEFFDEEECPACEAERWSKEYDAAIEREVRIYNKRTGESREANDFYYQADTIDKSKLRGLKMLRAYYDDYFHNQKFYEQEYAKAPQLELEFETDDLPF